MDPHLVILAGGISSRMKKAVSASAPLDPVLRHDAMEKSKSMIGVGEGHRPFLDYLLYNAREAGFRDVVIVVGEQDRSIREYYGMADQGNAFFGLTISYAVQTIPSGRQKPLGTADALLRALDFSPQWRGRDFTVCNSDNLYTIRALRLMLESTDPGAMIDYDRSALEFDAERIEQFSVTRKSPDGFLVDILEKPTPREIESARDSTGRIGVSMNIFRLSFDMVYPFLQRVPLHPVRQEKELPVAVQSMVKEDPRCMRAIPLAEHVPDLTNQSDIPAVQEYLHRLYPNFSLGLR